MKFLLCITLIGVFGGFAASYPANIVVLGEDDTHLLRTLMDSDLQLGEPEEKVYWPDIVDGSPEVSIRQRRSPQNPPFSIQGQGGSGRQGTDISLGASGRVWQSQNNRNELHAHGNYGRHFGGPSGASRPNYGAGLTFIHRF